LPNKETLKFIIIITLF